MVKSVGAGQLVGKNEFESIRGRAFVDFKVGAVGSQVQFNFSLQLVEQLADVRGLAGNQIVILVKGFQVQLELLIILLLY